MKPQSGSLTLSLVALAVAFLGLLLLGAAGPVYRAGLSLQTAFGVLRWGAYVGAAGIVIGIAAMLAAKWRRQRKAAWVAALALVTGVAAVGIPYSWQRRASRVPPIHDITTDLDKPPEFQAIVPLRADAPNTLERPPMLVQQQREGYPDLAPLTLPLPPDRVFNRALDVAGRMGWEVVASDQPSGRIEAIDTTRWFGFKDDVVVRVTPWGSGTRVDVRSVSRVGRSDVGTNASRIRDFLENLQDD
jgi:uncharacterized protein (DUF1499 family)